MAFRSIAAKVLALGLLLLSVSTAFASQETTNNRLESTAITTGTDLLVRDNKWHYMQTYSSTWSNEFVNHRVDNLLQLGVDEQLGSMPLAHPWEATVTFTATLTRHLSGSWVTTTYTNQQLTVSYDPARGTQYRQRDVLRFEDGLEMKVSITGVSATNTLTNTPIALPASVYLQGEIRTERYYTYDLSFVPAQSSIQQKKRNNNRLELRWAHVPGAEDYDLEWAYIDANSVQFFSAAYDFEENSNRVRVADNRYEFPLVFDRGYLIFRYRPVYRILPSYDAPLEGRWSTAATGDLLYFAGNARHKIDTGASPTSNTESEPHLPDFNWTYYANYAENGLAGHQVVYGDGLAKVRQTVGSLNTEDKVMVGTAVYDYHGRVPLHVLPSPVNNGELTYYYDMNLVQGSGGLKALGPQHFATDDKFSGCAPEHDALSAQHSQGAARYYSPYNPNQEGMNAYIPDMTDGSGNSYPFVITQYMPDGTGRIKRVSGVGAEMTLGNNHETAIYYDQPTKAELSYFFNPEDLGNIENYRKITTVDPNGQASIQYLDASDNVIMSKLPSSSPSSLDAVNPLAQQMNPITDVVLERPYPMELSYSQTMLDGEEVKINYSLTPPSFISSCFPNFCYECVYDVDFRLIFTNTCDEREEWVLEESGGAINLVSGSDASSFVTVNSATVGQSGGCPSGTLFSVPSTPANTGNGSASTSGISINTSNGTPQQFLVTAYGEGSLVVKKTLRLKDALETGYIDHFLTQYEADPAACGDLSFATLVENQLVGVQEGACSYDPCEEEVLAQLWANYQTDYIIDYNNDPAATGTFKNWLDSLYSTETEMALNDCYASSEVADNRCALYREQMLADFMPGGQYAQYIYDETTWQILPSDDPTSIFYITGAGSPPNPHSTTMVRYNDISMSYPLQTYVQLPGAPAPVDPRTLTVAEFVQNFDPSWAELFLPKHPEYCFIAFCESPSYAPYFEYEARMMGAFTFAQAQAGKFMNPQNTSGIGPGINIQNPATTAEQDPFTNANLTSYCANIKTVFGSSTTPTLNLWEATLETVHHDASLVPTVFNFISCKADREWVTFRALYLARRSEQIMDYFSTNFVPSCIGVHKLQSVGPLSGDFADKIKVVPNFPLSTLSYPDFDKLLQDQFGANYTVANVNGNPALLNTLETSECQEGCEAFADQWIQRLNGCSPDAAVLNSLKTALIDFCSTTCDAENPFGATTTSTAVSLTDHSGTPFTANSVEDILVQFFTLSGAKMPLCNPYLIANLRPEGQNLIAPYLDECACDKVMENKMRFASNTDPNITATYQLFLQTYGQNVPYIGEWECGCADAYGSQAQWETDFQNSGVNWSLGTRASDLAAKKLYGNEALSCPTCITCSDLEAIQDAFDVYFAPNTAQSYNWETHPYLESVFATFANQQNINGTYHDLTFAEYDQLRQNCNRLSATPAVISADGISAQGNDLLTLLQELVKSKLLAGATGTTQDLPRYFDFYRSSLYDCDFTFQADVQIAYTNSATQLQLDLQDLTGQTPVCFTNTTLHLQTASAFPNSNTWAEIERITNLEADVSTPAAGPVFDFRVRVWFKDGSSHVLEQCRTYESASTTTGAYSVFDQLVAKPGGGFEVMYCYPVLENERNECMDRAIYNAVASATLQYDEQVKRQRQKFIDDYAAFCSEVKTGGIPAQSLPVHHSFDDSYITLYYYDHLGQVVKTVPPEGVDGNNTSIHNHNLATTYKHNTLGQLVAQYMPDGGRDRTPTGNFVLPGGQTSYFVYNRKGQLVLSQNEEQRLPVSHLNTDYLRYSYSRYDNLGRPIEAGEVFGVFNDGTGVSNLATGDRAKVQQIVNHKDFPGDVSIAGGPSWTVWKRTELVKSYYDDALLATGATNPFGNAGQQNLIKRIASITWQDLYDSANEDDYDYASHYSYDVMGNVITLVNENRDLVDLDQQFKRTDYDFDLVSGQVLEVAYQRGEADQYFHRYHYDEDNRLQEVLTSSDGYTWEKDANYEYYTHGPLARMELGDQKVQALDYAYTAQGWLKGVNANTLVTNRDIGKDGASGSNYRGGQTDFHREYAQDAFGYSLTYYDGDYKSIKDFSSNQDNNFLLSMGAGSAQKTHYTANHSNLFNGNISRMTTTLSDVAGNPLDLMSTIYRYDQLNRLKSSTVFQSAHGNFTGPGQNSNLPLTGTTNNDYGVNLSYDLNGNIETLDRNAFGTNHAMDRFEYHYNPYNNQLLAVKDNASNPATNGFGDLQDQLAGTTFNENDQNTHNYRYDAIGNLIQDKAECIESIEWTLNGKVKAVYRELGCQVNGSYPPDLEFTYDPMGHRISKTVMPRGANGRLGIDDWTITYYSRDAQGNILATYERTFREAKDNYATYCFNATEWTAGNCAEPFVYPASGPGESLTGGTTAYNSDLATSLQDLVTAINGYSSTYKTNYGIVATLGDLDGLNTGTCITIAHIGTNGSNTNPPVFFGMGYDAGCGGTINSFSAQESFDPDTKHLDRFQLAENHLYGSSRLGLEKRNELLVNKKFDAIIDVNGPTLFTAWVDHGNVPITTTGTLTGLLGMKTFELSNHLGNVLATLSDRKVAVDDGLGDIAYFGADVLSFSNYYPFGMQMPNRKGGKYRFGLNGQERDDEISGAGNSYTAEYWQYDSRTARRWNIDPVLKYHESPYAAFANSPIWLVDPNGADTNINGKVNFEGLNLQDGERVTFTYRDPNATFSNYSTGTKSETFVYHAGNKHFAAGYYTPGEYEFVNLDYDNKQVLPPAGWLEFGMRGIPNPESAFSEPDENGMVRLKANWYPYLEVDQNGYLTGNPHIEGSAGMIEWVTPGGGPYKALRGAAGIAKITARARQAQQMATSYKAAVIAAKGAASFSRLAPTGKINPLTVRFSQNNIRGTFKNGDSVDDLIKGLKNGSVNPNSIPAIRIVEKNGLIYTLDNRRLYAFRQAGLNIRYQKLSYKNLPARELKKFTTTNNGLSIEIRSTN